MEDLAMRAFHPRGTLTTQGHFKLMQSATRCRATYNLQAHEFKMSEIYLRLHIF